MRQHLTQFLRLCAKTLPIQEPIYEFGALQVPGHSRFSDLRPIFPGKEYVGTDMREGPGVDKVVDLHQIELPPNSVGTALIFDTLEHVEYPRRAIQNIHTVLEPDGYIFASSVMYFPIHDHPQDFWRFTPEGFKSLLKPFAFSFVDFRGDTDFPHSVFGFACKGPVQDKTLAPFFKGYKKLNEWWKGIEGEIKKRQ